MSQALPSGVVAPNFRTPRLLGIFSVVFASELLIVGLCMSGYVAILPMFGRLMDVAQKQMEKQVEAGRKSDLAALAADEKAAKTEEQRIDVAVRRRQIEANARSPLAGMMDLNKATMGDPIFIRFTWLDALSGITLNVLLLAAGIGLLHWRPWARTLGVWTAALKLVRLVVVYGFFVIVIVPPYTRRLGKAAAEMLVAAQQMTGGKAMPFMTADFYTRMYTVMYTGVGLAMMLIGAVYPAIMLWLLTRPGVKSACSGLLRTPREPNQPC